MSAILLKLFITCFAICSAGGLSAQEQTIFLPGDNHTWEVDYIDGREIGRFYRQYDAFSRPENQRKYALDHMRLAGIAERNVHNIFRGEDTDGNIYVRKTLLEQTLIDLAFRDVVASFDEGTVVNVFAHSGGSPLALWSVCTNLNLAVSVLTLSAPGLDTFRLHRRGFSGDPILSESNAPANGLYTAWRDGNIIRNPEMLRSCEEKMRSGLRIRIVASEVDEFVTPDLWNELIWRFDEMNKDQAMPEDYFRVHMIPGANHREVAEAAAKWHGLAVKRTEGAAGLNWRELDPLFQER